MWELNLIQRTVNSSSMMRVHEADAPLRRNVRMAVLGTYDSVNLTSVSACTQCELTNAAIAQPLALARSSVLSHEQDGSAWCLQGRCSVQSTVYVLCGMFTRERPHEHAPPS